MEARLHSAGPMLANLLVLLLADVFVVFIRGIEDSRTLSHQLLSIVADHLTEAIVDLQQLPIRDQADARGRRPEDAPHLGFALPQRLLSLLAFRDIRRQPLDDGLIFDLALADKVIAEPVPLAVDIHNPVLVTEAGPFIRRRDGGIHSGNVLRMDGLVPPVRVFSERLRCVSQHVFHAR